MMSGVKALAQVQGPPYRVVSLYLTVNGTEMIRRTYLTSLHTMVTVHRQSLKASGLPRAARQAAVPDVVDEATEAVLTQSGHVQVMAPQPAMERTGRIGAFLRYRREVAKDGGLGDTEEAR